MCSSGYLLNYANLSADHYKRCNGGRPHCQTCIKIKKQSLCVYQYDDGSSDQELNDTALRPILPAPAAPVPSGSSSTSEEGKWKDSVLSSRASMVDLHSATGFRRQSTPLTEQSSGAGSSSSDALTVEHPPLSLPPHHVSQPHSPPSDLSSNQCATTSGLSWLHPSLPVEEPITAPLEPVNASPKLPDLMQDNPENMLSGLTIPLDLPTHL